MQTHLDSKVSEDSPTREFAFQADTMQVPCGADSMLSALQAGDVTAIEALVYLALNHASTWDSGKTWYISGRELARLLGISNWYVRAALKSLQEKGWISTISTSRHGKRYQLVHHRCDPEDAPVDADGKPLKFAVPRGAGGPFERLYAGDISWKACLVWIVYKLNSDWTTGETDPCTMLGLAERCGFAPNTIVALIQKLVDADMLHRLSKRHEKSVFQLYPKPYLTEVAPKPKREFRKERGITTDGVHWYSDNRQYRCSRETAEIEKRKKGGRWAAVLDRDFQNIPRAIRRDFDLAIEANRSVLLGYKL